MKKFLSLLLLAGTLSTTAAYGQLSNVLNLEAEVIHGQNSNFRNYVKNPTCKRNVGDITASSVAAVKNTTSALDGISDCTWNPTASTQTLKWQVKTWEKGLKGRNCEARILYNGDASLVKSYINQNSVKITSDLQLINSGTSGQVVSINYPCGDGSVSTEVVLESTGDAAIVPYSVYTGEATNLSAGLYNTEWQSYSPTLSAGFGTTTGSSFFWRRVGSNLEVTGYFVTGTVAGSIGSISLPTGLAINPSLVPVNATTAADGWRAGYFSINATTDVPAGTVTVHTTTSSSLVYFSNSLLIPPNVNTYGNNNDEISVTFSVPIVGWVSSEAIRMDQTNYPSTAYTPILTGFGTVTGASYFHERKGENVRVYGCHTNGTVSGTEASISLPGSIVLNTSKLPITGNTDAQQGSLVGRWSSDPQLNSTGRMLTAPGTNAALVYFGPVFAGSTDNLTPRTGTDITGNGDTLCLDFLVPISGWTESQNAPLIVGGVTSSSLGVERIERVNFGGAVFWTNNCTTSPCTIASSTPSVTTVTRAAQGRYDVVFAAGTFSAVPTCTCVSLGNGSHHTACGMDDDAAPTTTNFSLRSEGTDDGASLAVDSSVMVLCMGPR